MELRPQKEILWALYMSLRPSYFPLVFLSFCVVHVHELWDTFSVLFCTLRLVHVHELWDAFSVLFCTFRLVHVHELWDAFSVFCTLRLIHIHELWYAFSVLFCTFHLGHVHELWDAFSVLFCTLRLVPVHELWDAFSVLFCTFRLVHVHELWDAFPALFCTQFTVSSEIPCYYSFCQNFTVFLFKICRPFWLFCLPFLCAQSLIYPNFWNWHLTLILLSWRIWWAPSNTSRWQMGFNSAFKGLSIINLQIFGTRNYPLATNRKPSYGLKTTWEKRAVFLQRGSVYTSLHFGIF